MAAHNHLYRLVTAFPALRAALHEGRDWESSPDDWQPELPEMVPHQSFIEGSRDGEYRYVLARVVRGVRYHGGFVYDVIWLVDQEGDIVYEDSCDLDDTNYSAWYEECGPRGIVSERMRYVGEVAKSGDDALDFLVIPPPGDTTREEWQVLGDGGEDVYGREGLIVRAARREKRDRWLELAALPEYVRVALVGGRADANMLIGIESLQELRSPAAIAGYRRGIVIAGTLDTGRDGAWIFRAVLDVEPLVLRVKRTATEWLAEH